MHGFIRDNAIVSDGINSFELVNDDRIFDIYPISGICVKLVDCLGNFLFVNPVDVIVDINSIKF